MCLLTQVLWKFPSSCGTPAAKRDQQSSNSPPHAAVIVLILLHNFDQQSLTHYASPRSGDMSNDMIASPASCVIDLESSKTMAAPHAAVPSLLTPD